MQSTLAESNCPRSDCNGTVSPNPGPSPVTVGVPDEHEIEIGRCNTCGTNYWRRVGTAKWHEITDQ